MRQGPIPPWVDDETRGVLVDWIATLRREHPDLLAVILFGSIARHDERPVDDPEPSDVDVLVVCDVLETWEYYHSGKIFRALGDAYRRHPQALREVNVMLGNAVMSGWDPLFLENVAHDGIALFTQPRYSFEQLAMEAMRASTAGEGR
jgi:predicted nucleotidyltransferase